MFETIRNYFSNLFATGTAPGNRSLENPSTPLSAPDDWLWDAFGAGQSDAGTRVSAENALTFDPVWRAVTLISRDVAKLPLVVHKRLPVGKRRAPEHAADYLLHYKPNSEMSAFVFRQTIQAHALLRGNGYAFILRAGAAQPLELIPLLPTNTYPIREGGRLWYVTKVGYEWRRLDPMDVLHIKGLSPDGLCGYSLIEKARNSIGLGMATQEFSARFFRNNARPSAVIEVPAEMPIEARRELLREWNQMHAGLNNAHKVAILTNGGKLNPFSVNAEDAQLIDSRKFSVIEISNWFGVPPHKLGDSSRTAYNSLEQENLSYLTDCLDSWLVLWEQECRDKLLTEQEKRNDTHSIDFIRQALVQVDLATRGAYYEKAVKGPWLAPNEARAMENLNPISGGDVLVTSTDAPSNITDSERSLIRERISPKANGSHH